MNESLTTYMANMVTKQIPTTKNVKYMNMFEKMPVSVVCQIACLINSPVDNGLKIVYSQADIPSFYPSEGL